MIKLSIFIGLKKDNKLILLIQFISIKMLNAEIFIVLATTIQN